MQRATFCQLGVNVEHRSSIPLSFLIKPRDCHWPLLLVSRDKHPRRLVEQNVPFFILPIASGSGVVLADRFFQLAKSAFQDLSAAPLEASTD